MQSQLSSTTLFKSALCLLVGALMALSVGCREDVKDLRTEGIQQFRDRQYIESMATLRYALKKEPSDAESNYYMGLNYRALAERRAREGDVPGANRTLDVALFYFTQAIKTWPNYMAAVQAKTEALEMRGKYDMALSEAEKVSNNNRGIADHFIFLGDEYRARADYDNALRAYKSALSSSPNDARVHMSLGKLYYQAGDRDQALASFRQAQTLDRNMPDAGEIMADLGHSGHAEMASPVSTQLAPQEPTPTAVPRIYTGKSD